MPRTFLIADGDAHQLDLSRRLMQSAEPGAIVIGASSERDLMGYVERLCRTVQDGFALAPLLVFLEVDIPGRDGWDGLDLLRWIRGKRELESVPAVMLTSSRQPADISRARSLGASGYVIKHPTVALMREWLARGFLNGPCPGGDESPLADSPHSEDISLSPLDPMTPKESSVTNKEQARILSGLNLAREKMNCAFGDANEVDLRSQSMIVRTAPGRPGVEEARWLMRFGRP